MVKITSILLTFVILSLLIIREALFEGAALPPTQLPKTPIIDMHVHIAGLGYGESGCFISEEMKQSYKFDYYLAAFGVKRKELKSE